MSKHTFAKIVANFIKEDVKEELKVITVELKDYIDRQRGIEIELLISSVFSTLNESIERMEDDGFYNNNRGACNLARTLTTMIEERLAYIKDEKFIDSVVARIRNKQLPIKE